MNILQFIKKHPIRIGVGIILLSYIYELVFAGTSYRNRMPEADAAYDLNETVAGIIMTVGCAVLLTGIVVKIVRLRKKKRPLPEEEPQA
jgi:hypothetical protein